jgi:hypothetical protein
MNNDTLALLVPVLGFLIGCPTVVALVALLLPSTRRAIIGWIQRLHGDPHATSDAQLAALRSEVYALRCELAAVLQALPAGQRHDALNR